MGADTSRRRFIGQIVWVGASVGPVVAAPTAWAQAGKQVEETDETAVALGYRHDTTKVDGARYPKHTVNQRCDNCSFWQGKPGESWAGCAMFGRKHIAATGWCQAWAKAAG